MSTDGFNKLLRSFVSFDKRNQGQFWKLFDEMRSTAGLQANAATYTLALSHMMTDSDGKLAMIVDSLVSEGVRPDWGLLHSLVARATWTKDFRVFEKAIRYLFIDNNLRPGRVPLVNVYNRLRYFASLGRQTDGVRALIADFRAALEKTVNPARLTPAVKYESIRTIIHLGDFEVAYKELEAWQRERIPSAEAEGFAAAVHDATPEEPVKTTVKSLPEAEVKLPSTITWAVGPTEGGADLLIARALTSLINSFTTYVTTYCNIGEVLDTQLSDLSHQLDHPVGKFLIGAAKRGLPAIQQNPVVMARLDILKKIYKSPSTPYHDTDVVNTLLRAFALVGEVGPVKELFSIARLTRIMLRNSTYLALIEGFAASGDIAAMLTTLELYGGSFPNHAKPPVPNVHRLFMFRGLRVHLLQLSSTSTQPPRGYLHSLVAPWTYAYLALLFNDPATTYTIYPPVPSRHSTLPTSPIPANNQQQSTLQLKGPAVQTYAQPGGAVAAVDRLSTRRPSLEDGEANRLSKIQDLVTETSHRLKVNINTLANAQLLYSLEASTMARWLALQQMHTEALELIEEMTQVFNIAPNKFIFAALFDVYARQGSTLQAFELFRTMRQGATELEVDVYNAMLSLLAKSGELTAAMEVFSIMQQDGLQRTEETYSLVLGGCAKNKPELCEEMWRVMLSEGIQPSARLYTDMVVAWAGANDLAKASSYLEAMRNQRLYNQVAWVAVIVLHCNAPKGLEAALPLFDEVRENRKSPVAYHLYLQLFKAAARQANPGVVRQLIGRAKRDGYYEINRPQIRSFLEQTERKSQRQSQTE